MKNVMKLLVVAAFAMVAINVSAQQQKLGHVETQALFQLMPEMAKVRETMSVKQNEVEKELTNLQEQFRTKVAEYSEKSKTYSDVIRASKEQELQELQQRIQRFQEVAVDDLEKTNKDLTQPIIDKVLNAIKTVGKENGFTYIFDVNPNVILYVSENSQDIMPLVKAKLGLQ